MDKSFISNHLYGPESSKDHTRVEHKVCDYPCSMCNAVFTTEVHLFDHYSIIHSDELDDNFCKICQQSFSTQSVLKIHNIVVHAKEQDSLKELSPLQSCERHQTFPGSNLRHSFMCSICKAQFMKEDSLAEHINGHSENKSYEYFDISDTIKQNVQVPIKQEIANGFSRDIPGESMSSPNAILKECHHQSTPELSLQSSSGLPLVSNISGKSHACSCNCNDCCICQARLPSKDLQVQHENDISVATQNRLQLKCHRSSDLPVLSNADDKSNSPSYNCSARETQLPSKDLLSQSTKDSSSTSKLHKCPKCDKTFSTKPELKTHLRADHSVKRIFSCASCESVFVSKSERKEHYRTCAPEHELSCHNYSRFYDCSARDAQIKSQDSTSQNAEHLTSRVPLKCPECDKIFTEKAELKNHLRSDHSVKAIFSCVSCESVFVSRPLLQEHNRSCTPKNWFSCGLCDAKLINKNSLKAHLFKHRNKKRFECPFCDMTFVFKSTLIDHLPKHTGEKPFECDKCHKKFSHKNTLSLHRRTQCDESEETNSVEEDSGVNHSNDLDSATRFECLKCDKKFPALPRLRSHLRKEHQVTNIYSCTTCKSLFLSVSKLREHYRACAPESWFSCDVCEAKFSRKKSLQWHLQRHRNGERFACPVCDKKFTFEYSLRIHLPKHTGNRSFECDKCGKKFVYKSGLGCHKRRYH